MCSPERCADSSNARSTGRADSGSAAKSTPISALPKPAANSASIFFSSARVRTLGRKSAVGSRRFGKCCCQYPTSSVAGAADVTAAEQSSHGSRRQKLNLVMRLQKLSRHRQIELVADAVLIEIEGMIAVGKSDDFDLDA